VGEFRPRSLPGTLYLCGVAVFKRPVVLMAARWGRFSFVGVQKNALVEVCTKALFHNFYFLLRGLEGLYLRGSVLPLGHEYNRRGR